MKRVLTFVLLIFIMMTPITATAKEDIKTVAKRGLYTDDSTLLPYRLLLPDNYDENGSYPLIVFFHGAGERGDDNELQFFHCVQYIYDNAPEDCIIVAPQCPLNNQWVDTPWVAGAYSVDAVPESNELNAVMGLIEKLKTNHAVDPNRIYATGLSMGGFAVWDVLMRHNETFAAGVAVCGSGDPTKAEVLKDTPLYVFHGEIDTAVPVSGSRDTVAAIRNAGGTAVEYKEYKAAGHGIWNAAFSEPQLLEKLFTHKLSDRIEIPTVEDSSEPESVAETTSEESESEEPLSTTKKILLAVLGVAVVAAVVAAVIFIKKRK